jgi:MFS family permease
MDPTSTEPQGRLARRTFQSLWHRNFRLFFTGQLVSNSGNWLTIVALTLLVLHRTDRGWAVGLLSACQFGPILFLSPFAGLIADRSDKRRLLYLTQTLEMLQSFVLAALAFAHGAPLVLFYLVAVVGGCLLAFDNPARRSFVNEMVPAADVPNAITLYSAMVNISRIFGPALAGLLIVTVGYGWCFTLDAVSYATVLTSLVLMRGSELRTPVPTPRGRAQVRAGLRYILGVPELWITFVMLTVIGMVSYNFTVVFPLFVEKGLHGSDGAYTFVYSLFSAGALVGALFVARRRAIQLRTIVSGAAAFGMTLLLLAVVPDALAAAVVVVFVGVASVAYMTATTAIAQMRSEPGMLGRVLALQTVLLIGTTPIGGPLLGWASDALGPRAPVLIGGLAALGAAGFGLVAGRHREATPGGGPTPLPTGTQ